MASPVARYILQFLNDGGEPIETFESAAPFPTFLPGQVVEVAGQPGCWEVDAVSHYLGRTPDGQTLVVQMNIHLRERR